MRLFDIARKHQGVTNTHTREGIVHCNYKDKHVIVSSPDDFFKLDIEVSLTHLGLSHLE